MGSEGNGRLTQSIILGLVTNAVRTYSGSSDRAYRLIARAYSNFTAQGVPPEAAMIMATKAFPYTFRKEEINPFLVCYGELRDKNIDPVTAAVMTCEAEAHLGESRMAFVSEFRGLEQRVRSLLRSR